MKRLSLSLLFLLVAGGVQAELPVADLQRNTPVDFAKEVVPFLKKNCFACHNEQKAKADLNLESPQAMIAGGDSGPSLVPGKPLESLVFTYAAHLEDDPMPPPKNKSKAVDLSPEELALLKLWIEQGGQGESAAVLSGPSEWADLSGVDVIEATSLSDDGRFAAAGRGSRLHLYDLHRAELTATLTDPALPNETAHRDSVQALAFSRRGLLASGGFRITKLWQRVDSPAQPIGKPLAERPTTLALSPDGRWAAAGDAVGHVTLTPLAGQDPLTTQLKHEGTVRALAFAADGLHLYTLGDDRVLRRLALNTPHSAATLESLPPSTSLALLGTDHVALGGQDGVIRILPLTRFEDQGDDSPAPPRELNGHQGPVNALLTTGPEGRQLLSAGEDGSVRLWDPQGKQVRQIDTGQPVHSLAAYHPTNRAVTAGPDGVLRVWNTADGKKLGELAGDPVLAARKSTANRQRDVARSVAEHRRKQVGEREKAWTATGEALKKATEALTAARKDLAAKEEAAHQLRAPAASADRTVAALEKAGAQSELGPAKEQAKKANEALQKALGELANAERAFTGATRNRDLAVRDGARSAENLLAARTAADEADGLLATAEELLKQLEEALKTSGPGTIRALAVSADGATVSAATEKLGVQQWSLTTLKPLDVLARGRDSACVVPLPAGGVLAAFGDKSLARLQAPSWSLVRTLGDGEDATQLAGRVLALTFHPRGHQLATGSGVPSRSGTIKLWDVHTGAVAKALEDAHGDTVTGLAFSPDGSHIASSASDRLVKVHRLEDGQLLHKMEGHTNHVLGTDWSADGRTIVSAGADQVTKLWDADTGRQKNSEGGFKKEVTSITFLGTGESFLAGSGDRTVKAGGQNLGGNEGFVYSVAATPDGSTIVAGGEDGVLRVWQASDRKLLHSFPPPARSAPAETAAR